MAMSVENRQDRLGAAQVDAMFDFILVAAVAAAAAAVILAAGLVALGQVEPRTAAAWVAYILACALANVVLRALHRRSPSAGRNWRAWGLAFSLVNLGVGLGFGWAPIGLPVGGRVDVVLLVLIDTLCMAAGAITAFGPYLPTFVPFFLAATVPFAISGVFASDPLLHGLAPVLMLIFIGGMGGLGLRANLAFAQLVRLQIETEELARIFSGRRRSPNAPTSPSRPSSPPPATICASRCTRSACSSARCAASPSPRTPPR